MWRRLIPYAALIYGLFSVFTMQRDFQHITQLSVYVFLLAPLVLIFLVLARIAEKLDDDSIFSRYKSFIDVTQHSATQNLSQYILMFSLPFFLVRESWFYFGITVMLLGSTLWDPLFRYLMKSFIYRHVLQSWALLSAASFLFPFVAPRLMPYFYPLLAAFVLFGLLPSRTQKAYLLSLLSMAIFFVLILNALPQTMRFPLLSVWVKKPHFSLDRPKKGHESDDFGKSIAWSEFRRLLNSGHSICCVAPVVAPPGMRQHISQEWTLNENLIQRALLPTQIVGNAQQAAFHSYFCKKNITLTIEEGSLRCRIYLKDNIYIGGTKLLLRQN